MGVVECSEATIWIVSSASVTLDMLECGHVYVRRAKHIVVTFYFFNNIHNV